MAKPKKYLIILLVITCITVLYWGGVILFSDHIFLTPAGADGEPHKASMLFYGWIGLLIVSGFIYTLALKRDK